VTEPFTVHLGVKVPPVTYRHTAVEARFVVPFPQSILYVVAFVALQETETSSGAAPEIGVAVILSHVGFGIVFVQLKLHFPAWPFWLPSSHISPFVTSPSPQKRGETKAHSLCVITGPDAALVQKSYF
jgi:hypothetical protein